MRRLLLIAAVFLALLGVLEWMTRTPAITPAPGVLVADPPRQEAIQGHPPPLRYGKYLLRARATYRMRARVLSREDYRFDDLADLVPVDLALGWQSMSDSRILSAFSIRQHGRFYFWHADHLPIPRRAVVSESANVHMIPATRGVRDTLRQVRPGQVIQVTGVLVDAQGPDGRVWHTSLTRTDSGAGACELIYVQGLSVE